MKTPDRLFLFATNLVVGTLLLTACDKGPQAASNPAAATQTTDREQAELTAWSKLPVETRLRRLTQLDTPHVSSFNPRQELAASVAEAYCRVTKCVTDLASKVRFLPASDFINTYRTSMHDYEDEGIIYTQEEIDQVVEKTRTSVPEFVTRRGTGIFLNDALLSQLPDYLKRQSPKLESTLGKDDVGMIATESILWHAYTHANQKKEVIKIPAYTVGDLNTGMLATFDRMAGFTLLGKYQNSKPVLMGDFDEPIADLVGRKLAVKAGRRYLSMNTQYQRAADLLDQVDKKAGISDDQLFEIANGDLPKTVMIEKFSGLKDPKNPRGDQAIRAIYALGAYTREETDLSGVTLSRILSQSVGIN